MLNSFVVNDDTTTLFLKDLYNLFTGVNSVELKGAIFPFSTVKMTQG